MSIVPVSVRDLAIPLGGFANVMVAHAAPVLPGATVVAKRVRSLPAVLLKHKGEVTLPGPGCAVKCESGADKDKLLLALGAEPLLVELYHHDKYTRDVLLGIATVDMVKVLSARPQVHGLRTRHEHVQTVPFIAPAEGLLPATLAGDAAPAPDGTSPARHAVALLDGGALVHVWMIPVRSGRVVGAQRVGVIEARAGLHLARLAVGVRLEAALLRLGVLDVEAVVQRQVLRKEARTQVDLR